MELVERYLQAVKFWLPSEQNNDIIAELSEDLHTQVAEREAAVGRKLNGPEIEDLLRQRGAPFLVANRYLPQRSLIGPLLYPIYSFVLKIVLFGYLAPWVVTFFGLLAFDSGYRAKWQSQSWGTDLASFWGSLTTSGLVAVAIVTLVFAVLERAQPKIGLFADFNPKKLPPARNPNQISRGTSSLEIALVIAFIVGFGLNMASPILWSQPGARIVLTPQWSYFYWGILLLSVALVTLSAVNLVKPCWTRTRAALRLTLDGLGSVLCCWLLHANMLASIAIAGIPPESAANLTAAINLAMRKSVPFAILGCLIIAFTDVLRILRVKDDAGGAVSSISNRPLPLGSK